MPNFLVRIPTWTCDSCGYAQDFEPTQAIMDKHFAGVRAGQCPSCGAVGQLTPETNADKKTTVTVMGVEEVANLKVQHGVDAAGNPKTRELTAREAEAKTKEITDAVAYWRQHDPVS